MSELHFVALGAIAGIRQAPMDPLLRCEILADVFRINTLYMISQAGSGHIGSSFSCMDIITYLWVLEMRRPNEPGLADGDVFFSSKGHDVPALYALLIGLEKLDFSCLHQLRRLNGLPGHPDVGTPNIPSNTGSLGMGISKARGMVVARRMNGTRGRIFVLTGDGELQEGQIWESLQPTANGRFSEIVVIVDHNKVQSDTWVKDTSDLGSIEDKFRAFGWTVRRVDGHDVHSLKRVFDELRTESARPQVVIADTIKGRGVTRMQELVTSEDGTFYKFHSGAPAAPDYAQALDELVAKVNGNLARAGLGPLKLESTLPMPRPAPRRPQRLVAAYGDELTRIARERPDVVALDADLVLDTGLVPFRTQFPDRFVECGIAEQDMVSMAGGLALAGKVPIVHSFACFLSSRPNEQIFNNATERRKVIYVGSLAGVVPGGPGHSHQAVRDIAALSGIPGLTMIEPCNELETRLALRWAIDQNPGSTYLRLVSLPCDVAFELPVDHALQAGRGVVLSEGKDALLFAYGPILLSESIKAAEILRREQDIHITVVNLPWLNLIDEQWLVDVTRDYGHVVTLDNHFTDSGQGCRIVAMLAACTGGRLPRVHSFGIGEIPVCGQNQEVLQHHGLDADALALRIRTLLTRCAAE